MMIYINPIFFPRMMHALVTGYLSRNPVMLGRFIIFHYIKKSFPKSALALSFSSSAACSLMRDLGFRSVSIGYQYCVAHLAADHVALD
jgi:hypothetical protein